MSQGTNGKSGMSVKPFAFNTGDSTAGSHGDHDHENGELCPYEEGRVKVIADLPEPVRRRVAALRKLQIETLNTEAEFYTEIHELERRFEAKFNTVFAKRRELVNGDAEPSEADASFPLFPEAEAELAAQLEKTLLEEKKKGGEASAVKGVPDFWLTVLKNVEITAEMIQAHDEPILKHLTDIRYELHSAPMAFSLHFSFATNPHFTNTELTKKYLLKCAPDAKCPAEFEGPEIEKVEGCTINWNADKNVTVKLVKKKQKNKKQAGATRFVTKQVKSDSFFNFFDPPAHESIDDESMEEDDRMLLSMDVEIGQTIRDTIVPHALFHFTGEAAEDEDDDDYDEDEEDDEDDDGEDDDEDEEEEEE